MSMHPDADEDGPDEYPGMGLRNTPDNLDEQIGFLAHEPGTNAERLANYQRAYALLPEPRTAYYDSLWLLREIGTYRYLMGDYAGACATLRELLAATPEAALVPGVCVCMGMSLHELGNAGAWLWLWLANLLGGRSEFHNQEQKYWAIVERILRDHSG